MLVNCKFPNNDHNFRNLSNSTYIPETRIDAIKADMMLAQIYKRTKNDKVLKEKILDAKQYILDMALSTDYDNYENLTQLAYINHIIDFYLETMRKSIQTIKEGYM